MSAAIRAESRGSRSCIPMRLRLSSLAQARLRRDRSAAGGAGAPSSRTTTSSGRDIREASTPRMLGLRGHFATGPDAAPAARDQRRTPHGPQPTDHRAADPISDGLHGGPRHQVRCASLRDGLRPRLTPKTDEQQGGYRVGGSTWAVTKVVTSVVTHAAHNSVRDHEQPAPKPDSVGQAKEHSASLSSPNPTTASGELRG